MAAGGGGAFAICQKLHGIRLAGRADLTVPSNSVVGPLGPNGSGKTTAPRVLTTLLPPDAGRILTGGADAVRSPQRVRPLTGMAGQYAAVDPNLTGRENLVIRSPSWIPRPSGRGGGTSRLRGRNEAPAEQGGESRFAPGRTGLVGGGR
ncbi:ATP-binding cassette domain-containing protein [Streptomyces populi]